MFYLSILNKDLVLRVEEPFKPTYKSIVAEKAEWMAWDDSNIHYLGTMRYTINRTIRDNIPACENVKDYLIVV